MNNKSQTKSVKSPKRQSICKETIESMFHDITVAIMVIDTDTGKMIFFNETVCNDLDVNCAEIEGMHYKDIFWTDFIETYENLANDCKDGNVHTIVYYWAPKLIWEQISAKLFEWEDGRKVILLTITNITDVASEQYKYERLAYFDSVTGLPNGKRLEDDINKVVNFETVALIYFQIKGFYNINTLYGFDVSDSLVLQIRDWLLMSEQNKTQLYRGKHGLIILGHEVCRKDTITRTKEIIERFNHPWILTIGGREISIFCRIRIGIVYGDYVKNEMRTVLMRSLEAPVTEDGYSIYDGEAAKKAENILMLSQTLINCIQDEMSGFRVVYQPIVDAHTEKWIGVESLCRWVKPDGESVPPLKFIKLAEEMSLISKLDNWVKETAMRNCVNWGLNEKEFYLDVNFSSTQDIDESFIGKLLYSAKKIGYPIEKLVMEITESEKMEFNDDNISGLNKLLDQGLVISLDDFGTGYSTFENLIKIPASVLKTEKIYMDEIEKNEYKQYLIKMLINLAHHLNMKIICEGIETERQKKLMLEYGVDYMQGYLFSKPLEKEDLEKELWRFG